MCLDRCGFWTGKASNTLPKWFGQKQGDEFHVKKKKSIKMRETYPCPKPRLIWPAEKTVAPWWVCSETRTEVSCGKVPPSLAQRRDRACKSNLLCVYQVCRAVPCKPSLGDGQMLCASKNDDDAGMWCRTRTCSFNSVRVSVHPRVRASVCIMCVCVRAHVYAKCFQNKLHQQTCPFELLMWTVGIQTLDTMDSKSLWIIQSIAVTIQYFLLKREADLSATCSNDQTFLFE